jgi:hypothetical protein
LTVGLVLALAAPAGAQNSRAPSGEHGTELGGLVAAGTTSTHTGPALGGTAGWRLNGWVTAEARGMWLARGSGADAFEADLGALVNVAPGRVVAPYVGAAFGLYRAAFDSAASTMSGFYRRRLGSTSGAARGSSFTDPALRLSAGVDLLAGRRLTIRPEASALLVRRDGHGEAVGLFGVRLGYRFEEHPVTPTVSGR